MLLHEEEEKEEEDSEEENMFTCISYLDWAMFSSNFVHVITFLHVLHHDVLRRQKLKLLYVRL